MLGAPLRYVYVPRPSRSHAAERGRSSRVERQLPKLNVVGSNPIARSKKINDLGVNFRDYFPVVGR